MAKPVNYKPPRRFNLVSVPLFIALGLFGYFASQYVPLYFLKQEALRVIDETGSAISGHRGLYKSNSSAREKLRRKMEAELRAVGVEDPELECWIEVDNGEARLGAIYSEWLTWPFEVFPKRELVYEVELRYDIL